MMDGNNDMDSNGKPFSTVQIIQDGLDDKTDSNTNTTTTCNTNDLTSAATGANCASENEIEPDSTTTTTNMCNNIAGDCEESKRENSDKHEENEGCGDNDTSEIVSETDQTEEQALAISLTKIVLEEKPCAENGTNVESTTGENVETKMADSDELEKFNLYQYWYISPDMPLDPSIVDNCGSPKKENTEESNFIVSIHTNLFI